LKNKDLRRREMASNVNTATNSDTLKISVSRNTDIAMSAIKNAKSLSQTEDYQREERGEET